MHSKRNTTKTFKNNTNYLSPLSKSDCDKNSKDGVLIIDSKTGKGFNNQINEIDFETNVKINSVSNEKKNMQKANSILNKKRRRSPDKNISESNDDLLDLDYIRRTVSVPNSLKSNNQEDQERIEDENDKETSGKLSIEEIKENLQKDTNNSIQSFTNYCFDSFQHPNDGNAPKSIIKGNYVLRQRNTTNNNVDIINCHFCNKVNSISNFLICSKSKCRESYCLDCVQEVKGKKYVNDKIMRMGTEVYHWMCFKCHRKCPCKKCINDFPNMTFYQDLSKNNKHKKNNKIMFKKVPSQPIDKNDNKLNQNNNIISIPINTNITSQVLSKPEEIKRININDKCYLFEVYNNNNKKKFLDLKKQHIISYTFFKNNLLKHIKNQCDNYYAKKYKDKQIKESCMECFDNQFNASDLIQFHNITDLLNYLFYCYSYLDSCLCFNEITYYKNKGESLQFYKKNYKKASLKGKLRNPKTLCKMCLMKIMNTENCHRYLIQKLKQKTSKPILSMGQCNIKHDNDIIGQDSQIKINQSTDFQNFHEPELITNVTSSVRNNIHYISNVTVKNDTDRTIIPFSQPYFPTQNHLFFPLQNANYLPNTSLITNSMPFLSVSLNEETKGNHQIILNMIQLLISQLSMHLTHMNNKSQQNFLFGKYEENKKNISQQITIINEHISVFNNLIIQEQKAITVIERDLEYMKMQQLGDNNSYLKLKNNYNEEIKEAEQNFKNLQEIFRQYIVIFERINKIFFMKED